MLLNNNPIEIVTHIVVIAPFGACFTIYNTIQFINHPTFNANPEGGYKPCRGDRF